MIGLKVRLSVNHWMSCLFVLCGFLGLAARGAATEAIDCAWPPIESRQQPGAYWHWMASAVDEANLTRELETFKAAGLGGVHIIPIYGAKGYEKRYVEYLGPRWGALLEHTVREAKRLRMWVDMTTGSGWNFGGPNIPDGMANALVKWKREDLHGGQSCTLDIPENSVQAVMAFNGRGQAVDLSDSITPEGTVVWTAPEGQWTVLALWQENSGIVVERAAPGGEGWMLNLFQGGVMPHYLERFDAFFDAYAGPMPRAMYHDSYEYRCDWASDLFSEFEKRRGYRLQERLEVFLGDSGSDEQARMKSDYRETLSDMILENGIRIWADWAHRRGCITRNQAHGSPGNLLDLYAAADIPETEMFNKDRDPLMAKFASSAAHVAGKACVAAETGTWLREHFNVTLGDLKVLVDDMFVSGVNHVLYHGTCFSPEDAPWPGWLFYASTQMNPRNAFWRDVPVLNGYSSRCQALLQSSKPDNDILLYWPIHDLWHDPAGMEMELSIHRHAWLEEQPVGRVARVLWNKGYAFDYISDRLLEGVTSAAEGLSAGGSLYRVVLVPACTHMPLGTMERLRTLAEDGGTILFERAVPQDVPGLGALEERRAALSGITKGFPGPGEYPVGKGRVLVGEDVEALLKQSGVTRERLADREGLLHIRRRESEGNLYFLVNHGTSDVREYLPLSKSAMEAVMLDPMTEEAGVIPVRNNRGANEVFVDLVPGQSIFIRIFRQRNPEGPPWQYRKDTGEAHLLSGVWHVAFIEGGPVLPNACDVHDLVTWTAFPENPATEAFAGTARYSLEFDLPAAAQVDDWRLDLGNVADSTRVQVNGHMVGALILPPWTVDIPGDLLKPKGNRLDIEVTNLSANRIRDLDRKGVEWRIFNDINFVNIDYEPFDASNWPLRASGLLGPVSLTALRNR